MTSGVVRWALGFIAIMELKAQLSLRDVMLGPLLWWQSYRLSHGAHLNFGLQAICVGSVARSW